MDDDDSEDDFLLFQNKVLTLAEVTSENFVCLFSGPLRPTASYEIYFWSLLH